MNRATEPHLLAGDPSLPGGCPVEGGVNFVVHSGSAERIELCLFDLSGRETHRLPFRHRSGDAWHGFLPGAGAGLTWGLRAHGPFDPDAGLFFEPARLLIDPNARLLTGAYHQHPGHFPGERTDTAPWTPRCVVTPTSGNLASSRRPLATAPLIYEAHVRGLTMRHPDIPPPLRGTYAALGHPAVIRHLHALGIDALELLPVQFHIDEPHLVARGLTNYWGYSPVGCMALHPAYAANPRDPVGEFAASIRQLHAAGIEVILDVVFNHTAEGGSDGPILSLRGLDPHTWYLHHGGASQLADFTGCGNTLQVNHPVVADWVIRTLRYWAQVLDVDGFRFDLATTLGRQGEGFDPASGLLATIAADPVLGGCRLIAEPWDIGPHGYRLGGFGTPWAEWNDHFRDGARAYWRGQPGAQAELGRRLHGSSDLFEASGRAPAASINFITAHDGFCLEDLVSYTHKHNDANGEDNRDGSAHNLSDNLGHEGPTADLVIRAGRQRRKRALLATLLLAEGTPMLLAGDELGHTQGGNNNAYCQDNATTWLDWTSDPALVPFIRRLATLRRSRPPAWAQVFVHDGFEQPVFQPPAVAWFTAAGEAMSATDWHLDDCPFALLRADAQRLELCCFNRSQTPVTFRLPAGLDAHDWTARLDSAVEDGEPRITAINRSFIMEAQSVFVLDCRSQGTGRTT